MELIVIASRFIDGNKTLQRFNTLNNIKTRQHAPTVRNFTCVRTVLAKNTFWLDTNMIDYKFGIH